MLPVDLQTGVADELILKKAPAEAGAFSPCYALPGQALPCPTLPLQAGPRPYSPYPTGPSRVFSPQRVSLLFLCFLNGFCHAEKRHNDRAERSHAEKKS